MPAFSPYLPVLEFHPSLGASSPDALARERVIDRATLLEFAPDRESLLMGTKSIDHIRDVLRIRVGHSAGHWLYCTRRRSDIQLRGPSTRTSVVLSADENRDLAADRTPSNSVRRRLLSDSSINPLTSGSIANRLSGLRANEDSGPLISPHPLGPTHILVIYTSPASPPSRRLKMLPEAIELPINDLLFVLNAPNVSNPGVFPHKLQSELPRVLMRVRHLETFPELVVYLHTKNQTELFRRLLPEWMRDVMHPLPLGKHRLLEQQQADGGQPLESFNSSCINLRVPITKMSKSKASVASLTSQFSGLGVDRSVQGIAKEVAEAEALLPSSESRNDPLVKAVAKLDALKDNLEQVGFFGQQVWAGLMLRRDILLGALNWRAKFVGDGSG